MVSARLWRTSRGTALLLAATGLLWFAGTATGAWAGGTAGVVTSVLLAYRVPLIALGWHVSGTPRRPVIGASAFGCVAVVLPLRAAGVITAALLAVGAVRTIRAARSRRLDARTALVTRSVPAAALAALWLGAAVARPDGAVGDAVQLGVDLLVALLVIAVAWPADTTRGRGAAAAVVVELGSAADAVTPILARLRRMLADDDLQVRFQTATGEWIDDSGRPVETPDIADRRATRVPTPGGGAVALLHGPSASTQPDLSSAAAAASGLARERIELDAEARRQAALVVASRRRLLEAADDERRMLEAELRHGPLTTLTHVDQTLLGIATPEAEELRTVLRDAVDDLLRLGRGLYPAAVSGSELEPALRRLAATAPLASDVAVVGDVSTLSDPDRALVWFICSECLTNTVRYASATLVTIRCEIRDGFRVTVTDDGRGGAIAGGGHGLGGLADRIDTAGGHLSIDSPPGGPTVILATVPSARRVASGIWGHRASGEG